MDGCFPNCIEHSSPGPPQFKVIEDGMSCIIKSEIRLKRVQFRFPHSKKRRILNKWSRRERNVRYEPLVRIYRVSGLSII
jgi:hypothetical protein